MSKLREMPNTTAGTGIDLRYVGNQTSLVSLAHNTRDLAGVHLPRGELRKRSVNACRSGSTTASIASSVSRPAKWASW